MYRKGISRSHLIQSFCESSHKQNTKPQLQISLTKDLSIQNYVIYTNFPGQRYILHSASSILWLFSTVHQRFKSGRYRRYICAILPKAVLICAHLTRDIKCLIVSLVSYHVKHDEIPAYLYLAKHVSLIMLFIYQKNLEHWVWSFLLCHLIDQ